MSEIAVGRAIRELDRLVRVYGPGRWRKRLPHGALIVAEVHWYEAHGVGKKEFKAKHILGARP